MAALIDGAAIDGEAISERLMDLAEANSSKVRAYWAATRRGCGIPDAAYRGDGLFHFDRSHIVRSFRSSGTSGRTAGYAHYSPRGLDLLDRSILASGARIGFEGLDRPTVIRLVPDTDAAPHGIMSYGMALLSRHFGDASSSACVIGEHGVDEALLRRRLGAAIAEQRPVVLIGGSFALANLCDRLEVVGESWVLPPHSRIIDAGGFKGRSRHLDVDTLRQALTDRFGVDGAAFLNIYGMTELASQLYETASLTGRDEHVKSPTPYVAGRIRDPGTFDLKAAGAGLLEVVDLCIIDRPHVVLTGDWGYASPHGVAIAGRVPGSVSRGCALTHESPATLDASPEVNHD
ncbi:MAG: hypothetical protein VB131_07470 [Burkholderia gladioli]